MTELLPPLPPLPPPSARLPVPTARRSGGWLSLVIHLILVLILVEATRNNFWWDLPMSEGGPLQPAGGGGGGRQVTMIAMPEARRTPEPVPKVPPPPPVPVPVVTPVQVPPPVPAPPADTLPKTTGAAVTTGNAGGAGGGSGTGTGPGSGPGTGPGTGGPGKAPPDSARTAARDPEPRQLILIPFDYPTSMRGHTIQVTFFVLADGRVDRVLFSEDIPDRGYAKRLETVMRAYRFRPARSATGQPVPGHTIVSVTF